MILAHKIALIPNRTQREYFQRAAGCDRFCWNWALEEWNRQYAAGEKPNGTQLRKKFNLICPKQFPWVKEVHRDAHAEAFRKIQTAWQAFFKAPGKTGKPNFHKKGRKDSFYLANDVFKIKNCKVRLPRIGWIKMQESLRFSGKIMGAVVSCLADRWFIAVQVDVGEFKKIRTANGIVGIDLGVKTAITLSTGEKLEGPKPLKKLLRKIQRQSKRVSRKVKGSRNRGKASARLSRIHAKVANTRKDWLHKLTTRLCRENQAVGIEDLNVGGMLRNRKLARSISDMGWGEFRRQLEYKAKIYDVKLSIADRFFASSKTCSNCGHKKESMSLAERIFFCDQCGFILDRDVNAAKNLIPRDTGELTPMDSLALKATG